MKIHCLRRLLLVSIFGLLVTQSAHAAPIPPARAFSVGQPPASPVVLAVPADYFAADIEIRVDESDWLARLDAIDQTRRALSQAAIAAGFILHVDRPLTMRPEYGKSSYVSFSSGADRVYQPGADLRLLAPLSTDANPLELLRKMKALLDGLKVSKKTSVQIGDLRLAIDDPESHRMNLLAAIQRHLQATRVAMGANYAPTISRLDTPLIVSQLDERTVGVCLAFETSYAAQP